MFQENWSDFASCKGLDTSLFFPLSITKSNSKHLKQLFDFCYQCPVSSHCMYEAITTDSSGVWACTVQFQRRAYLDARNNSEPLTIQECEEYFNYIKNNKIYPYNRSYKNIVFNIVNSNQ